METPGHGLSGRPARIVGYVGGEDIGSGLWAPSPPAWRRGKVLPPFDLAPSRHHHSARAKRLRTKER